MNMRLNDWVNEIHKLAKEKGWWDNNRNPLEIHMLMVSEIAEATECYRDNKIDYYVSDSKKPEGEAAELVDCIIRIMDYFGYKGWNLETLLQIKHDYNKTRPYRHGGKKA